MAKKLTGAEIIKQDAEEAESAVKDMLKTDKPKTETEKADSTVCRSRNSRTS